MAKHTVQENYIEERYTGGLGFVVPQIDLDLNSTSACAIPKAPVKVTPQKSTPNKQPGTLTLLNTDVAITIKSSESQLNEVNKLLNPVSTTCLHELDKEL